jgi:hypothetical protein
MIQPMIQTMIQNAGLPFGLVGVRLFYYYAPCVSISVKRGFYFG